MNCVDFFPYISVVLTLDLKATKNSVPHPANAKMNNMGTTMLKWEVSGSEMRDREGQMKVLKISSIGMEMLK